MHKHLVPKACERCGEPMLARPNDLRRGLGRYCSRRCALDRRKAGRKAPPGPGPVALRAEAKGAPWGRCAACRAALTPGSEYYGYCAPCRQARRCRLCDRVGPEPLEGMWCQDCREGVEGFWRAARVLWPVHAVTGEAARDPGRAARAAEYARRAEAGLDLFEGGAA